MANDRTDFGRLERCAHTVTTWAGSAWAFITAAVLILLWLVTGPLLDYSDAWQFLLTGTTTVATFLMVFLLQRAQNKESQVVQIKLNELIAALEGASNRLINIEDLSEEEVRRMHSRYEKLTEMVRHGVRNGNKVTDAMSIEHAER